MKHSPITRRLAQSLLIAAAALPAACGEDNGSWTDPTALQSETALTLGKCGVQGTKLIDFSQIPDGTRQVKVCSLTPPAPSRGFSPSRYDIFIENRLQAPLTAEGMMDYQTLRAFAIDTFTLRPSERMLSAYVRAYLTDGSLTTHTDSPSFTFGVRPEGPLIETAYYYVGTYTGWNSADESLPMSNGGAGPYDNPVFTITVPAPRHQNGERADNAFCLMPVSVLSGDYGSDFRNYLVGPATDEPQSTALTGSITVGQGDGPVPQFLQPAADGASYYRITVDFLQRLYAIEPVVFSPYIYEIGAESQWLVPQPLYSSKNDGVYRGFGWLGGGFRLRPQADSSEGEWRMADGRLSTEGTADFQAEPGYYMIEVNLMQAVCNLTPIRQVSVTGSVNGYWDTYTEMTYQPATATWELTALLDYGELVFCANHSQDIIWGGSPDALIQRGPSLWIDEPGRYHITLHALCDGFARCEIVRLGD